MLRYLNFDTGGLAVAAAWLAFHHLSVTTELAVAAFLGSLGCISAGSIAGFSAGLFVCVKSGLAPLLYRKSCSLAVAQLL
ncbi:hypothetical protein H0E87_007642, partial [Populus deltoides]